MCGSSLSCVGLDFIKMASPFNGCKTIHVGIFAWKNILKMWLIPHNTYPQKPPGLFSNDRRLASSHFRESQILICWSLKPQVFHHLLPKNPSILITMGLQEKDLSSDAMSGCRKTRQTVWAMKDSWVGYPVCLCYTFGKPCFLLQHRVSATLQSFCQQFHEQ